MSNDEISRSMAEMRFTELPNPLSHAIDLANSEGLLKILKSCDEQLFSNEWIHPLHQSFLNKVNNCVNHFQTMITSHKKVLFIFSGAGTSGRIAIILSRLFNHKFQSTRVQFESQVPCSFQADFLIAGGLPALIAAKESAEDSTSLATKDLTSLIKKYKKDNPMIVYFGITCGLSATYVGKQLDLLSKLKLAQMSILVGFNDQDSARKFPFQGETQLCFQSIIDFLLSKPNTLSSSFFLLNPILGPEAITGSTRMKGGSATKLIVEAIMFAFLPSISGHSPIDSFIDSPIHSIPKSSKTSKTYSPIESYKYYLKSMESVLDIYNNPHFPKLLDITASSLTQKQSIIYLSFGQKSNCFNFLPIIDASECPPTFGSTRDQIRGFTHGGWTSLSKSQIVFQLMGDEYSCKDPLSKYNCSFSSFSKALKQKTLEKPCIVLFIDPVSSFEASTYFKILYSSIPSLSEHHIHCVSFSPSLTTSIQGSILKNWSKNITFYAFPLPKSAFPIRSSEFALKLILNAITVNGFIAFGKVFHNFMIDLKLSNRKLVQRARDLVVQFGHKYLPKSLNPNLQLAEKSLAVIVYLDLELLSSAPSKVESQDNRLVDLYFDFTRNDFISKAVNIEKIVPMSTLLYVAVMKDPSGDPPNLMAFKKSLQKDFRLRTSFISFFSSSSTIESDH